MTSLRIATADGRGAFITTGIQNHPGLIYVVRANEDSLPMIVIHKSGAEPTLMKISPLRKDSEKYILEEWIKREKTKRESTEMGQSFDKDEVS